MPSSSSPSRTNIKAQAPPERLAKRMAAALDRNAPPAELSQSCAIHNPLLLRPIANTGMASFRIALSGRLTLSGAAGLSSAGNMSINFNLHPSMCAQSRMKSRVSSAHLHKCKIKTASPGPVQRDSEGRRPPPIYVATMRAKRASSRIPTRRYAHYVGEGRGGAHESTEPGVDKCASPAPPRSPGIAACAGLANAVVLNGERAQRFAGVGPTVCCSPYSLTRRCRQRVGRWICGWLIRRGAVRWNRLRL